MIILPGFFRSILPNSGDFFLPKRNNSASGGLSILLKSDKKNPRKTVSCKLLVVLQWCNRDIRCKKLQLTDLLVSPVHHIMKIPLVVRDIEARTEDDLEKNVIGKILEMKENSLSKSTFFVLLSPCIYGVVGMQLLTNQVKSSKS